MTSAVVMCEVGVATLATSVVATSINAEPLMTALIGFGVSLVTMVGGELIKFLVAFLKNKTKKYQEPDKKE